MQTKLTFLFALALMSQLSGCGTAYYYYEPNESLERAEPAVRAEVDRYSQNPDGWRIYGRFITYDQEQIDARLAISLFIDLGPAGASPEPQFSIANLQVRIEPNGEWITPLLISDTVTQDEPHDLWSGRIRSSIFGPISTEGDLPKQVYLKMDLVTVDDAGKETDRRHIEMTVDRKGYSNLRDFLDGR